MVFSNLEKESLESAHSPDAIEQRLESAKQFNYLGDAVLGAIDGCVTTFAVVSGVLGGKLDPAIALLLGCANLFADGFSMAVSNYQRAKSEKQLIEKIRGVEEAHIEKIPEGEREEIYQIYKRKGFQEPVLSNIVEVITKDRKLWIDTMVTEEFGLQLESPNPYKAGMVTFLAFVFVGAIPLIPFLFTQILEPKQTFFTSIVLTAAAFFGIGILKGKVLRHSLIRSGLETLLVGSGAACLAYAVGHWLRGLVT